MTTSSTAGGWRLEAGKSRSSTADTRPPLTSSTRMNQRFEEETRGPGRGRADKVDGGVSRQYNSRPWVGTGAAGNSRCAMLTPVTGAQEDEAREPAGTHGHH